MASSPCLSDPAPSIVFIALFSYSTFYVYAVQAYVIFTKSRDGSRGVVLGVRTPPPPKYQTPSNLNTRTAHGPSTVRDNLRIAPDVRRLFVDRQEPEKLLKLPRYSNSGTVRCTGNFKHELFVVCTVNYTDDGRYVNFI